MDLEAADRKKILAQAAVLAEIRDTAGFKLMLAILHDLKVQAATVGIMDKETPIDHYRGYIDAVDDMLRYVDLTIERAREIQDEGEGDGREVVGLRIGRSGNSLATEEI